MKSVNRKLLCLLLGITLIACLCSIGAFADTAMLSPEDGMVSDRGTDSALTPEAGTVQGGDGTGIMDGVSNAIDGVSEGVSDVVSDVLDVTDGTETSGTATGTDTAATDDDGGSAAAAVIIFIIIAIAVVALVLVLVPKRRG